MENYCAFSKQHNCIHWMDYEITTNINFSQWDEIFGDALIADAIIDRLLHHATVVTIKGKSYRLQNILYGDNEAI